MANNAEVEGLAQEWDAHWEECQKLMRKLSAETRLDHAVVGFIGKIEEELNVPQVDAIRFGSAAMAYARTHSAEALIASFDRVFGTRRTDRRPVKQAFAASAIWAASVLFWRVAFGNSDHDDMTVVLAFGVPALVGASFWLWRWASK